MNKWISLCLIVVPCLMIYFFINNNVLWFFTSLLFLPIILIVNHLYENGFPRLPKLKTTSTTIKIKNFRKSKFDDFDSMIVTIPGIKKMMSYFIKSYGKSILSSNTAKSPMVEGLQNIKLTFLIFFVCLFIGVILFSALSEGLVFLILLIPLVYFFTSKFNLQDTITKRKKGIEKELMFFVVFCDIMDNNQTGIYKVFEIIRNDKSNLFPFMKHEALYIHREISIFGESPLDSLRSLCKFHPSKLFTDFIQGYLTSTTMGGKGTGDYLSGKVRDFQVTSKQNIDFYIEKSELITQIGSFGLVMFPLFIVIGGIMVKGNSLFMAVIFGLIFIPISISFMIKKIESIQPFPSDVVKFRIEPIIFSVIVLVITIVLNLEFWENVALPLIVWSVSNFILMRNKLITNNSLEKSIPDFIRDMNQSMLSISSFFKAFQMIQKKESYSTEFNNMLKNIQSGIIGGDSIEYVMKTTKTNSWLSKSVLKLLSFSAKSGTVTAAILEKLVEFSKNYLESKTEIAQKTSNSLMIGYMGSLIMVMILLVIPTISFDNFEVIAGDVIEVTNDNTINSLNYVLVIISSFFSMLLISKIKYSTINHSLHTTILLSIISVIFYYDKFIGITL